MKKMSTIKDLTGMKFGKLTVLRDSGQRLNRYVVWECKCDCGKVALVRGGSLTSGNTKSCGCLVASHAKDIAGMRFGNLVAIRPGEKKHNRYLWECKCDCGNTAYILGSSLLMGATKSCGCQRNKRIAGLNKKDLTGMKFGKLTAIRATEERKRGGIVWECKCDCGNTSFVLRTNLTSGNTRSCGKCGKRKTEEK